MGYSISEEQYNKLEMLRRTGRLCAMATGRGGCFSKATVRVTTRDWYYPSDKDAGEPPKGEGVMTFCVRHAKTLPVGLEGPNYTVLAQERY